MHNVYNILLTLIICNNYVLRLIYNKKASCFNQSLHDIKFVHFKMDDKQMLIIELGVKSLVFFTSYFVGKNILQAKKSVVTPSFSPYYFSTLLITQ